MAIYHGVEVWFRPLSDRSWVRVRSRKRAKFKARWSDTTDVLLRELAQIDARQAVIEADIGAAQVRNDGWIAGGEKARAASPAVVVYVLKGRHGPQKFPCETFDHWQDNLRAIALSLEALRKVDRYGVTCKGEQYAGFKALPPPVSPSGFANAEEALAWMQGHSGLIGGTSWSLHYRKAAKRLHPDNVHTGNEALFKQLQAAKEVLEKAESCDVATVMR